MTISLCMIVKNEEAVLARCLESVKDAVDEIVIVDTGSTDDTKKIAARYTDKVFDFAWIDDFSAARNEAFSHATMDYQMWLDADDVLPALEAKKLIELKKVLPPQTDMVTMRYITHFDDNGNPVFTSRRERLLRRAGNYLWQDPVHECIPLSGHVVYSDITVEHHKPKMAGGEPGRNLRIYRKALEQGREFTPRQLYYYARELRDHGIWEVAVERFEQFLDGGQGWAEDNIAACHLLGQCLRRLDRADDALRAYLRGLSYAGPRGELLCEIGYHHKALGRFDIALEWFSAAANTKMPNTGGFVQPDYYGYIPHIEMCVCLYQLGDIAGAKEQNRLAAQSKPGSEAVKLNDAFFASLEGGKTDAVTI